MLILRRNKSKNEAEEFRYRNNRLRNGLASRCLLTHADRGARNCCIHRTGNSALRKSHCTAVAYARFACDCSMQLPLEGQRISPSPMIDDVRAGGSEPLAQCRLAAHQLQQLAIGL